MAHSDNMMAQMTLTGHIAAVWSDARAALAEMPKASRWFHVFWLMGPLILLIERSPADAWLTICALTFAVRAVLRREGSWLKVFWVRAVFAFWGVCLLSAALSELPAYSLGEAFIWIRFPLFAMASCFWLAKDKRLLYAMMGMTMLGMIIMSGILTAEILIVGQQGGRLSWPYGDLVPGNYLAKVGLPAFSVLIALAVSAQRAIAVPAGLLSLATIAISIMTGERINFIIRACGGMLAAIVWRPKLGRLIGLVSLEIAAILLLFFATPTLGNRFVDQFISELPTQIDSPYLRVWNGGMDAFQTSLLLGIGPDNYRMLCGNISAGQLDVDCNTHPHNFYLQIAAETGLFGLVAGSVMVGSMIWCCLIFGMKNRKNVIAVTAFVVPLGLFFPIQSTADFFGQWNNIFMWSAVALALSAGNLMADEA